jgi:hypothetical protein
MPGPNHSILNPYRERIAELRKTVPPTPYVEIARILKEDHGIVITAGSIWSYVKARTPGKGRKLKYAMTAETAPPSQQQATAPTQESPIHAQKQRPLYEPEPGPKHDPYAP